MDLKEQELDWLCTHLGHTINVHREYYRLPQNTLEVAKIGKLLMAVEGGIRRYQGKSLDEITLSDIEDEAGIVRQYVEDGNIFGPLSWYCWNP
jgi:hypothetical protein